jgi:hypothetical protein
MKRLLLIGAALLLFAQTGISYGTVGQADLPQLPPYTGVIQNHTGIPVSFPSDNSSGTLIVPPKGFMEFISWHANFDLIGYVDGKPFFCQKVQVKPHSVPFMCKVYDFDAEIMAPPAKAAPGTKLKRRHIRKKSRTS